MMSAIAALFNVPSTTPELNSWAFVNMAHHRDISRTIYNLTGIALLESILDPMDPDNLGVWLYQHQLMHDNQNALLGIAGYDLVDVDWKDRDELAGWVWLHAQEHYQAADILKIG